MSSTTRTREASKTKHSEQNILNYSYDKDFGVLAVELLAYDPDNNCLRRVVCDSDGIIQTSGGGTVVTTYRLLSEDGSTLTTESGSPIRKE